MRFTTHFDEPVPLPQSFIDAHYCTDHVMAALGVDEPTFWGLYVSGRIPRGVSMLALCGIPLVVWPRATLDAWNAAGRPAEEGALEMENAVLHDLKAALANEGVAFHDQVAELN